MLCWREFSRPALAGAGIPANQRSNPSSPWADALFWDGDAWTYTIACTYLYTWRNLGWNAFAAAVERRAQCGRLSFVTGAKIINPALATELHLKYDNCCSHFLVWTLNLLFRYCSGYILGPNLISVKHNSYADQDIVSTWFSFPRHIH